VRQSNKDKRLFFNAFCPVMKDNTTGQQQQQIADSELNVALQRAKTVCNFIHYIKHKLENPINFRKISLHICMYFCTGITYIQYVFRKLHYRMAILICYLCIAVYIYAFHDWFSTLKFGFNLHKVYHHFSQLID
jgi:hypothetical protein